MVQPVPGQTECVRFDSKCPPLNGTNLAGDVTAESLPSVLNTSANISTPRFGDQVKLTCRGGLKPQKGPRVVTCGADGEWLPSDPRSSPESSEPTQCTTEFCDDVARLPAAGFARMKISSEVKDVDLYSDDLFYDLVDKEAPMRVR